MRWTQITCYRTKCWLLRLVTIVLICYIKELLRYLYCCEPINDIDAVILHQFSRLCILTYRCFMKLLHHLSTSLHLSIDVFDRPMPARFLYRQLVAQHFVTMHFWWLQPEHEILHPPLWGTHLLSQSCMVNYVSPPDK